LTARRRNSLERSGNFVTKARIPLTALARLHLDLRVSQKKQLRVLGKIASCGGLAALFAESVDQASDYENEPGEGFYPKARTLLEPSGSGLQRTKDVALLLGADPVAFRPGRRCRDIGTSIANSVRSARLAARRIWSRWSKASPSVERRRRPCSTCCLSTTRASRRSRRSRSNAIRIARSLSSRA